MVGTGVGAPGFLMKSKQRKRRKTSGRKEDRISALPDHLLCQILSLLPTKFTARTSALSKRWKDLFTHVPIIDCRDRYYGRTQNIGDFIAFISRVLLLIVLKLSHIQTFRIRLQGEPIESAIVPSWISTVVRYNVQELILLGLDGRFGMPLPHSLYSSKSLVVIKLQGKFVIDVPQYVSLPSLKTLSLVYVVFRDDSSVRRLLSASPVLENLILGACDMKNVEVFEVSCSSLKRFEIHDCDGDYELSVGAPDLKHWTLTYLDLRAEYVKGWESLPGLLENSPCLETLILWGFHNFDGQFPIPCAPMCFSKHLKTIQLNRFLGWIEELVFVEYILANAKALAKLILSPDSDDEEFEPDRVREEVSAFQIYSKACQIVTTLTYHNEILLRDSVLSEWY